MNRPKLLDLFCGAGGASMGYSYAGYDITGVDINPQPSYPFPFIQADAMEMLREGLPADYDAYHFSPPCQRYTPLGWNPMAHPDYLQEVLDLALPLDKPVVIENVENAAYGMMPIFSFMLCGSHFGMTVKYRGETFGLRRHRVFWTNRKIVQPACKHEREIRSIEVTGNTAKMPVAWRKQNPMLSSACPHEVTSELMGIDWIPKRQSRMLSEAIPPQYTHYIGVHLI